jgi:phosphatidate cytidylyltransferase
MKKSNLTVRIISAVVFGTVFVSALYFHFIGLWAFMLLLSIVALFEFNKLFPQSLLSFSLPVAFLFFILAEQTETLPFLINGHFSVNEKSMLWLLVLLVPITGVAALLSGKKDKISAFTQTITMILYCVVPFWLLVYSSHRWTEETNEYTGWVALFFFFFLWISDTGQYFSGRLFGKRKLFESLSPKKTVEGFVGGLLLAGAFGYAAHHLQPQLFPFQLLSIILGILLAAAGTAGDLIESSFKRAAGVKDSGNLIPGHGGVLDRFDSTLFAAPIYFVYLQLILALR